MQGDCMSFFPNAFTFVRLRCAAALLFFLSCTFFLQAQSPAFYRYGKESGLVCDEIYEVKQDRFGFIWIASDRGVFRYDGYNFQPFTTAQGLTDNTVFRLHEDSRGRMWLMPFNGELCYIENDKVVEYEFNDTLTKYFPGLKLIRSIELSGDGTMQIGMLLYGLAEISPLGKLTRAPFEYTGAASQQYVAHRTASGQLILGSVYDTGPPGVQTITYSCNADKQTVFVEGSGAYSHLSGIITASGTVYFGVGSRVFRIEPGGKMETFELPAKVICITEDRYHALWIGTEGQGVFKYPAGHPSLDSGYEIYYPGEFITAVVEDTDGSFWVATHHSGLLYVPNVPVRSWSFFENDESCELLADERGTMHVLWRDHGLTSIMNDSSTWHHKDGFNGVFKTLAWNNDKSKLLVSGAKGATELNPADGTEGVIHEMSVNSITCAGDRMYFGTSWNLQCRLPDGHFYVLGNPKVRLRPDVLLTDCRGTVWMGTLDGLYKIVDTVIEPKSDQHDLFTRRIAAMCEMKDSTLVVATQSNGIAFMKDGMIRSLTQLDDFPCDHIYGISAGDEHTVWCSTKDGLFRITVAADEITWSTVPAIQSLLGNIGKPYYVSQTHELWICNGNRVIAFDPDAIEQSDTPPPVYIRTVQSGDSILDKSSTAQLNYDENALRISFCGIAYRLQGHVSYRYRLKGHSDEWQLTDQNAVQFAALEAGEYSFEVQAQNENGVWSTVPAVFSFVIVPAFWQTGWFIILAAGVCALLMYVIIVARFRMIRRGDLLREQALIFRQQALSLQMNPHFIFNSLNTIQSFVLKEEKTKALDMFSSFATLLRKSLEHSTERYISLETEMQMLRLYFELEEMRFEGQLVYDIVVDEKINPEEMYVPAMLVQPMVENALHHGVRKKAGGGKVLVRFLLRNTQLICEVDDNGVGRSAEARSQQHVSAGIRITRDRLRVLGQMNRKNYTFEIIDKTDETTGAPTGTLVRFAIPNTENKSTAYEENVGTDSR